MALCGKAFCRHPLPLESVCCDAGEYFYLGGWDSAQDIPPCLFLAGFDQLLLAYLDRSRLLDDRHRPGVVTNTGIIHPTVLVDGRLMAKWRKDIRTLAIAPFARLTKRQRRRIADFGITCSREKSRMLCSVMPEG